MLNCILSFNFVKLYVTNSAPQALNVVNQARNYSLSPHSQIWGLGICYKEFKKKKNLIYCVLSLMVFNLLRNINNKICLYTTSEIDESVTHHNVVCMPIDQELWTKWLQWKPSVVKQIIMNTRNKDNIASTSVETIAFCHHKLHPLSSHREHFLFIYAFIYQITQEIIKRKFFSLMFLGMNFQPCLPLSIHANIRLAHETLE